MVVVTGEELIAWVGELPWYWLAALFAAPPLVSLVVGLIHGRDNGGRAPWRYLYSLLIYVACVPGIFACVLTAYTLFFLHTNLLAVNVFVYFAPIVSMVVTLVVVGRNADFDDIPGFDRLSGLLTIIAITFIFVLGIQKTRIWIVFGGSVWTLAVLILGMIALLQWGARALFRRGDDSKAGS